MPPKLIEALYIYNKTREDFIEAAKDFLLNSPDNTMYWCGLRLSSGEVNEIYKVEAKK